ncbi:MAG TPA: non-heme iron oxygenase ferredoxin subunit [Acidimicrobiales bacterium]|nr:non-heme iron oxygenase ferredoxin subunit [Acidimicrobiales bacterium]
MSHEVRLQLASIAEGKATRLEAGPFGICLVRLGDRVYALDDQCSHQEWMLSDGDVDSFDCTVECTKHGSTFSLADGSPQCLPATKPVAVYQTRIEADEVVVVLP